MTGDNTAQTEPDLFERIAELARETGSSPDEVEAVAREWADYERWKEAKVREALDELEAGVPGIPHEEVMAEMRALLGQSAREAERGPNEAAAREYVEHERWKEAKVQEAIDDEAAGDRGCPADEVFDEVEARLEERIRAADDIRRYSLAELRAMHERGDFVPTRPDAPEVEPDEEFWRNARVVMPPPGETSVHLRVDTDVLEWFKRQGRGHLTRMNAVLRAYMEAHRTKT